MTLRKRLFYNAKPTLLPCKRAAFGMQNNSFCNVLIIRKLRNRYSCEKYLHLCYLFSVYKIRENLSVNRIFKLYYFFASKLLLFPLLTKYGVIFYLYLAFVLFLSNVVYICVGRSVGSFGTFLSCFHFPCAIIIFWEKYIGVGRNSLYFG